MILLIEPVCYGNTHEIVNAGMLKTVRKAFDEKIVFAAESEHVNIVRAIVSDSSIEYNSIARFKRNIDVDSFDYFFLYFGMIERKIIKYNPRVIFVMSAYRPCIKAANLSAKMHKNIKICVILHSMIEEIYGKQKDYCRLIQSACKNNNMFFLSYSPFCLSENWNVDKKRIINIHHPYVYKQNINKRERQNPISIGVIGASANKRAKHIIKKIAKECSEYDYSFWVASRFAPEFGGLPKTRILINEWSRKDLEELMIDTDYILLPYNENEYRISASGVLWDAVTNEVPLLMLNSPYLRFYSQYGIGIQFDSVNSMINGILDIIKERKRKKFDFDVSGLSKVNVDLLRSVFGRPAMKSQE